MEPSRTPELTEAFPEDLRGSVRAVLEATSREQFALPRSLDDIGLVTLNGERLRIPARIYRAEPDWSRVRSRKLVERSITACLYTRHHDGYVRERALAHLPPVEEPWMAPFVIQLLGEYVIELVERAAMRIEGSPKAAYVVFLRENAGFLGLTTQRATSYWKEYHRQRFWKREDYPAFPALATLLRWRSSDTTA